MADEKRLAWAAFGNRLVEVHTTQDPTDAEWDRFIWWCNDLLTKKAVAGALVFSDGGSPTTNQRRRLATLMGSKAAPVAIITDSTVARAVVNLMSVFNPSLHAFRSTDLYGAIGHVGLANDQLYPMLEVAKRLAGELGGVKVVAQSR